MGLKFVVAALVLGAAISIRASAEISSPLDLQKTVKDKVYSKEQATRGAALYAKHCERCHDPAKVPEGKKPGPPTIGAKFLETWQDKTLGELFATIFTTMPSDGSMALTADETLDSIAHILKANGFPEGTAPLKNDDAMKAIVIVK
jgi:mono/diheme cytochrome c family protein